MPPTIIPVPVTATTVTVFRLAAMPVTDTEAIEFAVGEGMYELQCTDAIKENSAVPPLVPSVVG